MSPPTRACPAFRDAIADHDALGPAARRALDAHAALCPACARALADARRADAHVRGLPVVAPPPGFAARLLSLPGDAPPAGPPGWARALALLALAAVLGAIGLRGGAAPEAPAGDGAPAAPVAAGPVARRTAVALLTPRATTAPAPTAALAAAAEPGGAERVAPPPGPAWAARAAPSPAPPSATAQAGAPPGPDAGARRKRKAVPPPTPPTPVTPSAPCATIAVRVFADLVGADGAPCVSCDGRWTPEDEQVARALDVRLPDFQLAILDETTGVALVDELVFEDNAAMVTVAIPIACPISGPIAVALAGGLGAWSPCPAGDGLRQTLAAPFGAPIDFALTSSCPAPSATASADAPSLATATAPPTPLSLDPPPPAVTGAPPDGPTGHAGPSGRGSDTR